MASTFFALITGLLTEQKKGGKIMGPRKFTFTLDETFRLLGIGERRLGWCKSKRDKICEKATNELDWTYVRADVRERYDGIPELVLHVPFEVKGL